MTLIWKINLTEIVLILGPTVCLLRLTCQIILLQDHLSKSECTSSVYTDTHTNSFLRDGLVSKLLGKIYRWLSAPYISSIIYRNYLSWLKVTTELEFFHFSLHNALHTSIWSWFPVAEMGSCVLLRKLLAAAMSAGISGRLSKLLAVCMARRLGFGCRCSFLCCRREL